MFDATKNFIFEYAKFGVYFGAFYFLLDLYVSLICADKLNKVMSRPNEKSIENLEKRTLELEKRDNNREESKELFLMNSWKNK